MRDVTAPAAARPASLLVRVRQDDRFGCVVACLAMVLRRTYDEIRAEIGAPGAGLTREVWEEVLARHSHAVQHVFHYDPVARQKRTPWPLAPWADLHLCAVDAGRGTGSHLVVMLRDGSVLDPATEEPRSRLSYPATSSMTAVFPVGAHP